jgi:hypothetical protein
MESILVESHLVCKDVRPVSSAIAVVGRMWCTGLAVSFDSDETEISGKDIRHPEPVTLH